MGKKSASSVSRILVAVDGSKNSDKAVGLGIDMAKKWNAEIHLIHVMDIAPSGELLMPDVSFYKRPESEDVKGPGVGVYYDKICEQIIVSAERRMRKAGIKKVNTICVAGNPADEIIKVAKKNKVDLIIMGNRGKGRFSKAIMGSVSTKVCNFSENTCITVK